MPWSKKPRKNLIYLFDAAENYLEEILLTIKARVCNWARTRAGAIPPKDLTAMEEEMFL
jgi:hypothetical protein